MGLKDCLPIMLRDHQFKSRQEEHSTSEGSSTSTPERVPFDDSDYVSVDVEDPQGSIAPHFRNMAVSSESPNPGRRKSSSHVTKPTTLEAQWEKMLPPVYSLPPELLIAILSRLSSCADLRSCMLVNKRWASCAVDLLWHRPVISKWGSLMKIVTALRNEHSTFPYSRLIRRLNLTFLAENISDGTMTSLSSCTRLERLTLTNCKRITDHGLINVIPNNPGLLALDLSNLDLVTDHTLGLIATNCRRLQGLNLAGCNKVTDSSLIPVALHCRQLKRLKLNECTLLTNDTVYALSRSCSQLLEIDLYKCHLINDEAVVQLITNLRHLRELRLAYCDLLTDESFLSLPIRIYESLRILDLTGCELITDRTVAKIVSMAPRLRNLVLAKCKNITDRAVGHICKLGKNVHFLALGYCPELTDDAVIAIAKNCTRIRYIDLAGCTRLTDNSICELSALPKLRRVGLVKCADITDQAILALVTRPNGQPCPLERIHLSYCTNLTLNGIQKLLDSCTELTHLSLTGVNAFLKDELTRFCRPAPTDFTDHQRRVFCVFSGMGVSRLRNYLNQMKEEETAAVGYYYEEDQHEMEEETFAEDS